MTLIVIFVFKGQSFILFLSLAQGAKANIFLLKEYNVNIVFCHLTSLFCSFQFAVCV